jgi:hypothetical protein
MQIFIFFNESFSLFYVLLTFFVFSRAAMDRCQIPYDYAFRLKAV